MKNIVALLAALLFIPAVLADGTGDSFGGEINIEDFDIKVWQCGHRIVADDDVDPWRTGTDLRERNNNYLFEGETYSVDVLVMDKNKIDEAKVDVYFDCPDGKISLNCVPLGCATGTDFASCNAMIDEEHIRECNALTMKMYRCNIEVPDSEYAYGECVLSVKAVDSGGAQEAEIDETADWFLNPMVQLDIDGQLDFSGVRPGTSKYSRVTVKNTAEGGVIMDMFITGEDWDSIDSAQGRCWDVNRGLLINQLPLSAFRYYAENGAFSSRDDAEDDADDKTNDYNPNFERDTDDEGYVSICKNLGTGFDERMFNECEILQANPINGGSLGYLANLLYPGSIGVSMTFRLELPEPCYGNFANDEGFRIWGEAV